MSTPEHPVCSGAPLDLHGRARNGINDCPFPVTDVVVGLYPGHHGEPVTVLATSCKLHVGPIASFVGEHSPEDLFVAHIDALPVIVEQLTAAGEDLHWMEYQAA